MSILDNIASQRQKLLDGIDANEGDINLRIFEDFYPDEAHFIYELLQNAEDAGATEVMFELTTHACYFEHNGSRHFDERDIRGITGIFNSSKKDNPDKIGKFGVGFKSVFVYTDTPVIYSKDYSFKILKLVLPEPIKPRNGLGQHTRFEFPFNNPKKDAKTAFSEVKAGLEQLSETTLLFLNNLRYISWRIGNKEGAILREEHSASHVEMLKLVNGKEVLTSHWLRFAVPVQNVEKFNAPVDGVERQKVAVAFELAFLGDITSFDGKKALAKQLKIVPAVRGKVSVFFPAEKETSGLRFHLHAPFIPELSRASIKSSPENLPLFEQLAIVAARSLHEIKALGLLTGEFLSVLPNNDDSLPERYGLIRGAMLKEMRTEPLVPKYGGGFAPAARLYQARASLKALLSNEDLAFITERNDQPAWAIAATQRNSNQDRFLASLDIRIWDVDSLQHFFETKARRSNGAWDDCELNQGVINWLSKKSYDWLQGLYALLYKHCEDQDDYGKLSNVYFIKLTSKKWSTGESAYFAKGPYSASDTYLRVDENILTEGNKKAQKQEARRFLERLGVREPTESDEIHQLLMTRYSEKSTPPSDKDYLIDLKRMILFSETNPNCKNIFGKYRIFKAESLTPRWENANNVYLDEPFTKTELKRLYNLTTDQKHKRWPLDSWYLSCGIPKEKIAHFAEQIGCKTDFDNLYEIARCTDNPNWSYLSKAPGSRSGNVVSRDYALTPDALLLLQSQQLESALLVWKALCRSETVHPTILKAFFQLTDKGGPHFSESQLVCVLKKIAWVPQIDGSFVKPSAAVSSRLPKGFVVDAGYKWMEAVGFGTDNKTREKENAARAIQRKQLGFGSEAALQEALDFAKLPSEERKRFWENAKQSKYEPIELPERPIRNAIFRTERVIEQAKATPEKIATIKPRSVQMGVDAAKTEAKLYLIDQYTNINGQMICQACKGELPFRLPNGSYYFEAVEIILNSPKRFREGYLVLCPNHAAAYQYANGQRNAMHELIATAAGNEIDIVLGGLETEIYFTEMHMADAKACLDSIDNDEN